jgi:alpha-aminoadipate/glutamate carrier protein LysW
LELREPLENLCVYHLTLLPGDSKYKCRGGAVVPARGSRQEREAIIMVICPECEGDLDIEEDEVDEGEIVSCPECGTDFEVVAVEPLELTRVEDEDEEDEEEEEEEE